MLIPHKCKCPPTLARICYTARKGQNSPEWAIWPIGHVASPPNSVYSGRDDADSPPHNPNYTLGPLALRATRGEGPGGLGGGGDSIEIARRS